MNLKRKFIILIILLSLNYLFITFFSFNVSAQELQPPEKMFWFVNYVAKEGGEVSGDLEEVVANLDIPKMNIEILPEDGYVISHFEDSKKNAYANIEQIKEKPITESETYFVVFKKDAIVQKDSSEPTENDNLQISSRAIKTPRATVAYPATIASIFPDSGLATVVANALGKQVTDTVVKSQLQSISTLFALNHNISDLTGLEELSKVQEMYLGHNQIADISGVDWTAFPLLRTLGLDNNLLTDLSTVNPTGLGLLKILYLGNNMITDISSLNWSAFSSLQTLFINDNAITDLSQVSWVGLSSLKELGLDHNEISDLSQVNWTGLDSLTLLYLGYNKITNISTANGSGLHKLEELYLDNNEISDISTVNWSALDALKVLHIAHNDIADISQVNWGLLANLKELYFDYNKISDISQVNWTGANSLTKLYLNANQISDLSTVNWVGLNSLQNLYLNENKITDLSSSNWSNLTSIELVDLSLQNATLDAEPFYKPIVLDNKILNTLGGKMDLTSVSDSGSYSAGTGKITWNLANYISSVNYSWNGQVQINGTNSTFSGTAVTPLIVPYQVTFKDWDATILQQELKLEGATITPPANPARSGYTFNGWNPTVDATVPSNDVEYIATYTPNSNTVYKTEYYQEQLNASYQLFETDTLQGTTDTTASAIVKTYSGYTFDTANASNVLSGNISGDGSLVLKVYYKLNNYVLTFEDYDGITLSTSNEKFGALITAPSNPTRTGYTFVSWAPTLAATMPANNLTYTATYTVNSYTVTYLDFNNSVIRTDTVNYNASLPTAPAIPAVTGYTSTGWDTTLATTMPANNLTYTATYTINSYTVTYLGMAGSVLRTDTLNYGATLTAPPAIPIVTGYTSTGWNATLATTMPDNNLTYTALYAANSTSSSTSISFSDNTPSSSVVSEVTSGDEQGPICVLYWIILLFAVVIAVITIVKRKQNEDETNGTF